MKINFRICSVIALVLLCLCGIVHSQDEAVKMVLDILKSDDQDMQSVAISMVVACPATAATGSMPGATAPAGSVTLMVTRHCLASCRCTSVAWTPNSLRTW